MSILIYRLFFFFFFFFFFCFVVYGALKLFFFFVVVAVVLLPLNQYLCATRDPERLIFILVKSAIVISAVFDLLVYKQEVYIYIYMCVSRFYV